MRVFLLQLQPRMQCFGISFPQEKQRNIQELHSCAGIIAVLLFRQASNAGGAATLALLTVRGPRPVHHRIFALALLPEPYPPVPPIALLLCAPCR